ncbi:MAG TPA: sortase, partial [Chloroflexota bacterium]|nr:sortase [Chloroflexota bacterium]
MAAGSAATSSFMSARAALGNGSDDLARLVAGAVGNALFLLGGFGLLLLGAGAFPQELLGKRAPDASSSSFAGSSWRDSPDQALSVGPDFNGRVGASANLITDDSGASGASSPTEHSAPPDLSSAVAEVPPDGTPTVTPTPSRTPTPTRTPSPAVTPVALASGLTKAPITKLRIARIRLDSKVVPAFLTRSGATTWDVPAFNVGHGIHTAGAGEPGNGVLIGHVSSISFGNVFRDLGTVRAGDIVQVFSEERGFDYVVTEIKRTPRTDLSMLESVGA